MRRPQAGFEIPSGTATLVPAGPPATVTVTNVDYEAGDLFMYCMDTPGGTPGNLEIPVATRLNAAGTFVLNSDNALDASTVMWAIIPVPFRQSFGGFELPSGTATLAAGTIAIANVDFNQEDLIIAVVDTPAGVAGFISVPVATRNAAAGTFTINSTNAGDTSTVMWTIIPVG